jgi:hypothetical protein
MRFLPLYLFPPAEARKGRPGALTKLGDTPHVAAEIIFKVKCESTNTKRLHGDIHL